MLSRSGTLTGMLALSTTLLSHHSLRLLLLHLLGVLGLCAWTLCLRGLSGSAGGTLGPLTLTTLPETLNSTDAGGSTCSETVLQLGCGTLGRHILRPIRSSAILRWIAGGSGRHAITDTGLLLHDGLLLWGFGSKLLTICVLGSRQAIRQIGQRLSIDGRAKLSVSVGGSAGLLSRSR